MSQQTLSSLLTGLILLGLLMFGLGSLLWIFGLLVTYSVSWELQLAILGILILIFGALAARLLSRD